MPDLISLHFSLAELTITQQTGPDGKPLVNLPNQKQRAHLTKLANTMLEPIRELWGCPVRVTSAFRCTAVEVKVSGKAYGQHMLGQAADILPVSGLSLKAAYELIWRSKLPYDQLLIENSGDARWIHVSIASDAPDPRREALMTPDTPRWFAYDPQRVKDNGSVV